MICTIFQRLQRRQQEMSKKVKFTLTARPGSIYPMAMTDDLPKPPNLLKIKDLAERLGCTRQTVHNMLREGRCPVAPIPGSKPPRWLATTVDAFLNGGDA